MELNFSDNDTVSDDIYLARLLHGRDRELINSDWTQLLDSPLDSTTKAAWGTYRADLRGFETQIASGTLPRNILIPAKP